MRLFSAQHRFVLPRCTPEGVRAPLAAALIAGTHAVVVGDLEVRYPPDFLFRRGFVKLEGPINWLRASIAPTQINGVEVTLNASWSPLNTLLLAAVIATFSGLPSAVFGNPGDIRMNAVKALLYGVVFSLLFIGWSSRAWLRRIELDVRRANECGNSTLPPSAP
jgi:hypothetical protein